MDIPSEESFDQLGLFEDSTGYPGTTTVSSRFDGTTATVNVSDIAHSLSFECRYGGHSTRRLNVAQHSLIVAALSKDPFEGLMHDAHEAYIKDVPKPLKMVLPDYRALEDQVASVVREKFGLPKATSPDTRYADLLTMYWEATWIVHDKGKHFRGRDKFLQPWMEEYELRILTDEYSKNLFMTAFSVLSSGNYDSFIRNVLRPELGLPQEVDIYGS